MSELCTALLHEHPYCSIAVGRTSNIFVHALRPNCSQGIKGLMRQFGCRRPTNCRLGHHQVTCIAIEHRQVRNQCTRRQQVTYTIDKRLAQVVHNFAAQSDGDLALAVGDIVVVTKGKEGEAWWKGHIQGNKKAKGVFPATFVQVLEPEPEPEPALLPQSGARCTVLDFLTVVITTLLSILSTLSSKCSCLITLR